MNYEAWRISYQSSEQAARAAFQRTQELEQKLKDAAAAIHYPDCWDTAAYPSLMTALNEIGCNPANCAIGA
jgi:hypothetical protein